MIQHQVWLSKYTSPISWNASEIFLRRMLVTLNPVSVTVLSFPRNTFPLIITTLTSFPKKSTARLRIWLDSLNRSCLVLTAKDKKKGSTVALCRKENYGFDKLILNDLIIHPVWRINNSNNIVNLPSYLNVAGRENIGDLFSFSVKKTYDQNSAWVYVTYFLNVF